MACGGAWMAIFRRGFLRRVDQPRVPPNLRFPVEEELAGKSHLRQGDPTAATAATEGSRRKIKRPEGNTIIEKKKIGFPLWL